jgi:hypothetical protein
MSPAEHSRPETLPDRIRYPHPDRLDPSRPGFLDVVAAHDAALCAGHDTYRDPLTGFDVMTSPALLARGRCCTSGCRHCPFAPRPGD